ncbi:lysine-rich arabinogalactan protein 19-like [Phaseolus vulgaris]|uniref:lysine-rich arabinogalactan protein 19-like n=1 Tax=Phaseolus vulgaris TaxID=3885 RepID=UPI0035CC20AE
MSGKDRRKALLELAKLRGAKGTGSSSSTTDPIAAPPLSVAPAEGPEPERKIRKLVKAFPSSAAAAAPAPSTEEESSGSPLVHRKRKLPAVEGASSLQPGEIEVVEVEEGSPPPSSTQPAPVPTCLPSPRQQPSPAPRPPSPPPAGQSPGQPAPPSGGASAHSGGLPPPLPTSAAAECGGASSRPSVSGASHENFSRVITLVRQLICNREIVEWSEDKFQTHLFFSAFS